MRGAGAQPARLVAAIAVMGAALAAAGPAAAGAEHDWIGVAKCARCHDKELIGDQVAAWAAGPHRRAFETLANEESLAIAKRMGLAQPPQESDACLRCHQSAFGVAPTRIAYELDPAEGVQCESCHGPGRDYRKKKIMSDRKKAEAKGLWDADGDPAICTACHNEESPTFDPKRYTLPDGSTAGFDFEQAKRRDPHPIPEHVKGRFLELEEAEKKRKKAGR